MPSLSFVAFRANYGDVERLLEIHTEITGDTPGRRHGVEVLNKSGIVLTCAIWEAYCEDIAAEAVEHLILDASDMSGLPNALRKQVADELKNDPHDLAVWTLADDGWRSYLRARIKDMAIERNRQLNTPKTENLRALFDKTLGLPKVPSAWYWPGMSAANAAKKLDKYVALRGDIAHRGTGSANIQKDLVWDFAKHVEYLVGKTDTYISGQLSAACGVALF